MVIPGESEDDFRQMHDQFVADFFPRDIAEGAMVHDLAAITWKRLRLERLEQSSFVRSLTTPIKSYEICHRGSVEVDEGHEWLINDLGRFTDSYIADYKRHLAYLEPLSDEGISKDTFYELPKEQPSLSDTSSNSPSSTSRLRWNRAQRRLRPPPSSPRIMAVRASSASH